MIRPLTLFFLLFANLGLAQESALSQLTLKQAYELALKRSEVIAIQAEVIKEAQARFSQSLSGILPHVAFVHEETFQQPRGSNSRHFSESRFVFTQALFSGFKEFAAIAASKAERRQREHELERAKQILFTDVSDAFYLLKTYQEDLNVLGEIHKALDDRFNEIKKREGLGRSRMSEVVSVEAKIYQNEADREFLQSQKEISQQLLEFLVGQPIKSLSSTDVVPTVISTLENYMAQVENRPDVKAAKEALLVARKNITIARAGYWPTVDLVGNNYVKRHPSQDQPKWDVGLAVNVPLFTGGDAFGQTKQAQALAEQALLNLNRIKREAILNIQNNYTRLISTQKQARALQKAVTATQKNYDYQSFDYKNSLVNNLDVLISLEDLQTVRRLYINLKHEAQRAYWNLKVATGDIDDTL